MRLDQILTTIADSDPERWSKLDVGYTHGPSYRYWPRTESWSDPHAVATGVTEHHTLLVYTLDVDLTIAFGIDPGESWFDKPGERDQFDDLPFADPNGKYGIADVFWCGSLVHRQRYVVADGGRYYLPMWHRESGNPEQRYVAAADVPLIYLIHEHGQHEDFESGMRQYGLPVHD